MENLRQQLKSQLAAIDGIDGERAGTIARAIAIGATGGEQDRAWAAAAIAQLTDLQAGQARKVAADLLASARTALLAALAG